jgi:hypothetical protein
MRCARRLLSACLAVVALLGAGAASALAQEGDGSPVAARIFGDYAVDRVIDGHYSSGDLRAALEIAQANGAGFEEFSSAVQETYDRDILGLSVDGRLVHRPVAGADRGGGLLTLPEPRGPGERDQPPWPFLALSALAAALVVTGAGSSILRRVRR